eukprot:685334-Amphidinium_carterae.1
MMYTSTTLVPIRGRRHNLLRERSQGCDEQGVGAIDQQEIIRGSRQEVIDKGTVAERGCYKMGFSQFIHDTDAKTFAATPSSMAMRLELLLTIAIIKKFTVFTTDVA